MIYVNKTFRFAVYDGNKKVRPATGEAGFKSLERNDLLISDNKATPNGVLLISSIKDLKSTVWPVLVLSKLIAAFFICITTLIALLYYTGRSNIVILFLLILVTLLFIPQAADPVVHDNSGLWVRLRNGATNMNNGQARIITHRRSRK